MKNSVIILRRQLCLLIYYSVLAVHPWNGDGSVVLVSVSFKTSVMIYRDRYYRLFAVGASLINIIFVSNDAVSSKNCQIRALRTRI